MLLVRTYVRGQACTKYYSTGKRKYCRFTCVKTDRGYYNIQISFMDTACLGCVLYFPSTVLFCQLTLVVTDKE